MVRIKMNKFLIYSLAISTSLMVGCNKSTPKETEVAASEVKEEVSDWSCTAQANIDQIQSRLKEDYLKELDKKLRSSSYVENQDILATIQKSIKFELKGVTTITQEKPNTNILECSSQLIVHLPKGLQKRSENAYLEMPCADEGEYCSGRYESAGYATIHDYIEDSENDLIFKNDQVMGKLKYTITKTDKDGLSLSVPSQSSVITAIAFIAKTAAQYESYAKENAEGNREIEKSAKEESEQRNLAKKSLEIRKKELDKEKLSGVERLNQSWDNLSVELKEKYKQEQVTWFEKRDVDCKVISQKSVYQLSDSEKETYQEHSRYWDEALEAQNMQMQYNKCFIERTNERVDVLDEISN